MKSFEEMWKQAKELGEDVKGLAEDFFKRYADKIKEDDMLTIIGILAEIDGWHNYVSDEKVDLCTFKAEINKLRNLIIGHSHLLDKVVAPIE